MPPRQLPRSGAARVPRLGVDTQAARGDSPCIPRAAAQLTKGGDMHNNNTYHHGKQTVQARQVTSNTYKDVAAYFGCETWGAGVLVVTSWGTDHAGVGDWIVRAGQRLLILSNRDFTRHYRPGPSRQP